MNALPSISDCWIVAHRGVSDLCPENTRAAFQLALEQQADAIECDLQMTRDGHVIVCHDEHLGRYGHHDVRVAESHWEQLQSLDVGSWFHPDFCDQRLLTLEQLLDEFGPQCRLLLEIKVACVPQDAVQEFLSRIAQAVTVRRLESRVAVLCFDMVVLRRFQQLAPWAACVLNVDRPQDVTSENLEHSGWLKAVDSNIQNLQAEHVQLFQQHQLVPMCYTCDSEAEILKAWKLEVAAIITNDPQRTRTLLAKMMQSHAT